MIGMNIFQDDAFSMVSMTQAVDKMGHTPQLLRNMAALWVPVPVRTETVFIESRENAPALIQTDERGAAPKKKAGDKRQARGYRTVRVSESSRITASSLANIRGFGTENDVAAVQVEVARRQQLIGNDMDLTEENMLLGMVQGKVYDADGTTVLFDWAAEFGQSIPAELNFDLENPSAADGAVLKNCNKVTRSITRALKGMGGSAFSVAAICGDDFFDDLTTNKEVRDTYKFSQATKDGAQTLRQGTAFKSFVYGDITWINYRGTDDNSTVIVPATKAKFFPVNAGIFQMAYSPGEDLDMVGTLGLQRYSRMVVDKDRNSWADVEMYSYPLPVCVQPSALFSGKNTA